MFPSEPRAAIALLPHLLGTPPDDRLLMVGLDADGSVQRRGAFPIDCSRPLDEPILESSLWGPEVRFAAVVAYSERTDVDLAPLIDAWVCRNCSPVQAIWAGAVRWRSHLCTSGLCCLSRGNRYGAHLPGHDDYDPFAGMERRNALWRRAMWSKWLQAIADVTRGVPDDAETHWALAHSLHDIPVRDALLASCATMPTEERAAVIAVLTASAANAVYGLSIPVHTCIAALHYLDGDTDCAARMVGRILTVDEYSLARLLHNGLEMRAPASLLARSFSHFNPLDLLAA